MDPGKVIGETSAEQPPLEFPQDTTRYKIMPSNTTVIRKLWHNMDNRTSEEALDMLQSLPEERSPKASTNSNIRDSKTKEEAVKSISNVVPDVPQTTVHNPKLESELLQRAGAVVAKDSSHRVDVEQDPSGKWPAVAATVFLLGAMCAYAAMIMWRKSLVRRYGSRHVLVNEDSTV